MPTKPVGSQSVEGMTSAQSGRRKPESSIRHCVVSQLHIDVAFHALFACVQAERLYGYDTHRLHEWIPEKWTVFELFDLSLLLPCPISRLSPSPLQYMCIADIDDTAEGQKGNVLILRNVQRIWLGYLVPEAALYIYIYIYVLNNMQEL